MTREDFVKLTQQGTVLLDGATGTVLRAQGMPVGVSPELWAMEHPEMVKELQRAYAEAGCQIVYAPTFGANRISLANFGLEERVEELNKGLVALTREAVGGRALVAGDMTTTGKILEPLGDLSYETLYEVYQEQGQALVEAGADLIVAETMLSVEETTLWLDAMLAICDLPLMCTLTVQADGTALYGGSAIEAVQTFQEMGASAVGINCSMGPDQLESVVAGMKAVATIPIIAKPNAGLPTMNARGEAIYSMGPDDFVRHMRKLVGCGAGLIGGCCGTTPEYMRKLAEAIGRRPAGSDAVLR